MVSAKLLRFFCLVALMVAMDATPTPPSPQLSQQQQQQAEIGPVASLFNIRPLSIFTGHCNASVARGATVWKPVPGVVDVFFPKVVSIPDSCFLFPFSYRQSNPIGFSAKKEVSPFILAPAAVPFFY